MGYRLPLDSLPWVGEGDQPCLHRADPIQRSRRCRAAARCAQDERLHASGVEAARRAGPASIRRRGVPTSARRRPRDGSPPTLATALRARR